MNSDQALEKRAVLQRSITQIGQQVVQCLGACAGVVHDAAAGILPRCPIIERAECGGRGCLVVAPHPCRSKPQEQACYRERGPSYEVVTTYWRQNVDQISYYKSLRQLFDLASLTGPIIWSNLAKCENSADAKGSMPLQTLRVCATHFLQKELEVTPKAWPAFGLGRDAYKALAYLEPTRTVIGIPHPTGSSGQFRELFIKGRLINGRLRDHVAKAISAALADVTPVAVWVS
jgi:hypothetical protein